MAGEDKKPSVIFLAEHMADAGVNDRELAEAIGVTRETVTRWRNRDRKVDLRKIDDIAKALRKRRFELFELPRKMSLDALVANESDATRRGAAEVVRSFLEQLKITRR